MSYRIRFKSLSASVDNIPLYNSTKQVFETFYSNLDNRNVGIEPKYRDRGFKSNPFEEIIFKFRSKPKFSSTSSVSSVNYSYFISFEIYSLISKELSLPPHEFFKIKYLYRNKQYNDCYFLTFTLDLISEVDFEKSEFWVTNSNSNKDSSRYIVEDNIQITTIEEYLIYKSENNGLAYRGEFTFKKMVFNDKGNNYDCFPLMWLDYRLHVSEKFKWVCEKNKLSNIEFLNPLIPIELQNKAFIIEPNIRQSTLDTEEIESHKTEPKLLSNQETLSIYKTLENKLEYCSNYFQHNTLKSSINKYHDYLLTTELHSVPGGEWTDEMKENQRLEYLESSNDLHIITKIKNIENFTLQLEEQIDARKVYQDFDSALKQIDTLYKEGGKKYDTIFIKFTIDGVTDFYFFTENNPYVQDEYRIEELDSDNFDSISNNLMKNYVGILSENDIMDLEEQFEEIEYIDMMKKRLFYKSYLHLRAILLSRHKDFNLNQSKSPVFIFIMEEFEEDQKMECVCVI